jgi:ParB family chromosome partitioning protein
MHKSQPPEPRKALGRGLSALLPAAPQPGGKREFLRLAIEDVHPASEQPRRRFEDQALSTLVESIRKDGVLQPLLVRQRTAQEGGGYSIIAGERRWRAAQRAGLQEVPAVVRETTPREAFELALIENLQREDLNPIEEAEAYERLIREHGMTQEQMAERVGRDRSTIANALRLLKLPEPVRDLVERGQLSMGQARALAALEQAQVIEQAAKRVVTGQLSVRQVEALVRKAKQEVRPAAPAPLRRSASVRDLERRLERALATRVQVLDHGGRGTIEIHWGSLDELDRLLAQLWGES